MSVTDVCALDDLIEAYKHHQRRTRGLRERTLRGYESHARRLMRAALGDDDPIDPARLTAADVVAFVAAMTGRFSPRSMKTVRTAVRSFLRFLRVEGFCDERLEACLPAVAAWRLAALPMRLSDEQLEQVLASLEGNRSRCGLRDRAIVVCLATLGLRPGEVAELRLDDIDWRHATVEVGQRKNRRSAVLPLPREAGEAIVAYLGEQRPHTERRQVFVQHIGPRRGEPIKATAVSEVVARALRRAGVQAPMVGAYVLRHTVASRMVQRGVGLKEVADFLGHRSLDTTAVYAKVDLPALQAVALPWPEAVR